MSEVLELRDTVLSTWPGVIALATLTGMALRMILLSALDRPKESVAPIIEISDYQPHNKTEAS